MENFAGAVSVSVNESCFVLVGIARGRHEASRTACVLTTGNGITSLHPANTLFSDTAPFRASLRFGRTADSRHTITALGPLIMSRPASSTTPSLSVDLGYHPSSESGGVPSVVVSR